MKAGREDLVLRRDAGLPGEKASLDRAPLVVSGKAAGAVVPLQANESMGQSHRQETREDTKTAQGGKASGGRNNARLHRHLRIAAKHPLPTPAVPRNKTTTRPRIMPCRTFPSLPLVPPLGVSPPFVRGASLHSDPRGVVPPPYTPACPRGVGPPSLW